MKRKKVVKILTVGVVVGSLLTSNTVWAAENSDTSDLLCNANWLVDDELRPYSSYLHSGSISFSTSAGTIVVNVVTKAYQSINHIYHDITIYKNGSWYSSDRYEEWSVSKLNTHIDVPVQSGDTVEVYVDHYAEHGGVTESTSTSKTKSY